MLVVFYSKFTTEPSILQTWWHYILSKTMLCLHATGVIFIKNISDIRRLGKVLQQTSNE